MYRLKQFTLFVFLLVSFKLIAQTPVAPVSGDGTMGNPYQIDNLDNLAWISTNSSVWGSYFIQTADINASATSTWNGGEGWSAIGNGTEILRSPPAFF